MCALPHTSSITGLEACKQLSHRDQAARRQDLSLYRSRSVQALSRFLEPVDERRDLLATFVYILCRYPRAPQAEDELFRMPSLGAFSEAHRPLDNSSHALQPETAFHLVASLVLGLELDVDCIVHALLLLERLGRDLLGVLLTEDLWRNTVITAFVIATKLTFDEATWLEDVRRIMIDYGYKAGRLHQQELLFLKLIHYDACMTRTQFTIYLLSMKSVGRSKRAQQLFQDHDYMKRFRTGSDADCTDSLEKCRLRGRTPS